MGPCVVATFVGHSDRPLATGANLLFSKPKRRFKRSLNNYRTTIIEVRRCLRRSRAATDRGCHYATLDTMPRTGSDAFYRDRIQGILSSAQIRGVGQHPIRGFPEGPRHKIEPRILSRRRGSTRAAHPALPPGPGVAPAPLAVGLQLRRTHRSRHMFWLETLATYA